VGTYVRALLRDSTRTHGSLVDVTSEAILLRRLVGANEVRVVDRSVPLDSVMKVWRRAGSRWSIGALTGVGIGAFGALITGAVATSTQDRGSCGGGCWATIVAIGAGTGGLLGALIGHQIARWEIVPQGQSPSTDYRRVGGL
jgi:hypothetical protein